MKSSLQYDEEKMQFILAKKQRKKTASEKLRDRKSEGEKQEHRENEMKRERVVAQFTGIAIIDESCAHFNVGKMY